jgi:hypothetical protein
MSKEGSVRFARWVFLLAGIIGLIEVTPLLFMENLIGLRQPPTITHPEFYYGFVVIVLVWQIAFLIIARDPVRYQPLMPALFLEKLLYPIVVCTLYAQGRVDAQSLPAPVLDLMWLTLFVVVWVKLRNVREQT